MKKTYYAKIYSNVGAFITTMKDVSFSSFRKQINSGLGQLVIAIPRKFGDFDEDYIVKLNNRLELWVIDQDTGSGGKLMYSGFISQYNPVLNGAKESVTVRCLGYVGKLATSILKSTTYIELKTDTTSRLVTGTGNASAVEIANVIKKILDLYQAEAVNPVINYGATSVGATGNNMTYTFNAVSYLDAINKCKDLAPAGWHWYVGANNILKFKAKSATPDHSFILGKHFSGVNVEKNMEGVFNRILVSNGDNNDATILKLYSDTVSSADLDDRWQLLTDSRVSIEDTINNMGNAALAEKKDPIIRTKIEIADNNGKGNGYDIESIEPGNTCQILGFNPVTSKTFGGNMQIISVEYTPDKAVLELEDMFTSLGREIVKNKKEISDQSATSRPRQYGIVQAPQGSGETPVGGISAYAGTTDPLGWLICDGRSLLRADYPLLFNIIGVVFGTASGAHFNIPDMRDNVPVGKSATKALGTTGGSATHALTTAELAAHAHTQSAHTHTVPTWLNSGGGGGTDRAYTPAGGGVSTTTTDSSTPAIQNAGSGTAHNNLQPYLTLNHIIKI